MKILIALAAALAATLALAGTASGGGVQPMMNYYGDDGGYACTIDGSQGSAYYDVSGCSGATDADEDYYYYATVDGSGANCRSKTARNKAENIYKMDILFVYQRVKWCWRNGNLVYFFHEHWPDVKMLFWSFQRWTNDSHTSWPGFRYASVQGSFRACALYSWLCQNVYLGVWQEVGVNGYYRKGTY